MEHKTANIKIRLRPSEYDFLKSKSNNNFSKYCRSVLLDTSYNGPSLSSELYELRKEINRIGNNINQLAKHANSGEQVDISGLSETIDRIQKDINKKFVKMK